MATTYLTRQISTAGSRKKATISLWVKRGGGFGNDQRWFSYENTSVANNVTVFKFSGDSIQFADQTGGSNNARYDGTRKLRDSNAWYHFLVKMDTTQSTEADRLKIFINGELQSEVSYTYPSQDSDLNIGHNSNAYIDIGRWRGSNNQYFDGCMSHYHFCDGYAYDASSFGETDSTTGEWKIKTSPSVSYGTNGFFILKDGNSVTDQSGQGNNFTVGAGTLTNTEDCPSDNFATLNNLFIPTGSDANYAMSFSNGNTSVNPTSPDANGSRNYTCSTLAMKTSGGKYYAEFKINPANDLVGLIGLVGTQQATERFHYNNKMTDCLNGIAYDMAADRIRGNSTDIVGSLTAAASNDIVGIGIDMDNKLFYAYLNGTLLNSGGSSFSFFTEPFAYFCLGDSSTSGYDGYQANFGNGYFGTTAISSEGTNASGIGKFEYDVPSGFTALSTKGLNE